MSSLVPTLFLQNKTGQGPGGRRCKRGGVKYRGIQTRSNRSRCEKTQDGSASPKETGPRVDTKVDDDLEGVAARLSPGDEDGGLLQNRFLELNHCFRPTHERTVHGGGRPEEKTSGPSTESSDPVSVGTDEWTSAMSVVPVVRAPVG